MDQKRHFTNRRRFIATIGFGAVSLYGLWAAYGAAPGPGALFRGEAAGGGEHGGHGAADGSVAEDFERQVDEFIARYRLDDGAVYPRRQTAPANMMEHESMGHGSMPIAEEMDDGSPIDVYLLASRFSYEPSVLRLDRGVAYRFRMMAADSTHGASIHLGGASRIIRLRPNAPVEQTLTFHEPGNYLAYCTVYCGAGHDSMQGRIVVV